MSAKTQIVVSSDLSGQLWNVCVWDLLTGNTLMTYKSAGVVNRHSLDLIADQFVIASQKDTPIIDIWSLERKDQLHMKIISSGKVTALKVTNDGLYCIAAIGASVHVWQLSSGNLLAILEKHYQPITCIKIASDSSYFVSGGEDGIALVWRLSSIISKSESLGNESSREAVHKWTQQTNAITDIHIGFGGFRARCVICSADHSCRIYELISGHLIATIVFDTPLRSVVMDFAEYYLFVGGDNGNIYETKLCEKPPSLSNKEITPTFIGHSQAVTCLSVSIDGLALISGSNDGNIKVWHIPSKHCMRTIANKGPISNIMVFATPSGLNSALKSSNIVIEPLKRSLVNNSYDYDSNNAHENDCIQAKNNGNLSNSLSCLNTEIDFPIKNFAVNVIDSSNANAIEDPLEEVRKLKQINRQIYNYAVESIFKSIA